MSKHHVTYTVYSDGDPASILDGATEAAEQVEGAIQATGCSATLDHDETSVELVPSGTYGGLRLTNDEAWTAITGLRLAAEQYEQFAALWSRPARRNPGSDAPTPEASKRLAEQFKQQAAEARALMTSLEERGDR
jgi:hypothetical protein